MKRFHCDIVRAASIAASLVSTISCSTSGDGVQEGVAVQELKHGHGPGKHPRHWGHPKHAPLSVQLGPRPYYLVDDMDEGPLKDKLESCSEGSFETTDFSIGHRGAGLQFPEHTLESYKAAARTGAGIVECDVTFTKDRQLVCRHSQCDLHTTTNILLTPLAEKCSRPFVPADPTTGTPASARCCTTDVTLDEFKSLCGKMDSSNPNALTPEEYVGGTPDFRTDLYATCGTLMTHAESIELIDDLGLKFTPELKTPSVTMPYEGDYTQEDFAQQMIDEYKAARIDPRRVYAQSFLLDDILYWIERAPRFGRQAVYLDGRYDLPEFDYTDPTTWSPNMVELRAAGVRIIAPPMWMLLAVEGERIVPSEYAQRARMAGLDLITWTLERDGYLRSGGGWYHQSISSLIDNDGDTYEVLDVLARQVGVLGVFSDWPATVTYYANCMGL